MKQDVGRQMSRQCTKDGRWALTQTTLEVETQHLFIPVTDTTIQTGPASRVSYCVWQTTLVVYDF